MPERVLENVVPNKEYIVDEKQTGTLFDVDDDIDFFTLTFSRSNIVNIKNRDIVSVKILCSYDDGVTFEGCGGFTAEGGDLIGRSGQLLPYTSLGVNVRKGIGRKIKVECTTFARTLVKIDLDYLIRPKQLRV